MSKYRVYLKAKLTDSFTLTSINLDEFDMEEDGVWLRFYENKKLVLMVRECDVKAVAAIGE
jgi:hypothetical protein